MAEQQANKKCHKVVTCMVIQFTVCFPQAVASHCPPHEATISKSSS